MNILLWVLQVLLAAHTVMGAVWKFSHSEQSVPSLAKIPHGAWLGLAVLELFLAAGLLLTAYHPLAMLAPIAALALAAEMLLFCGVHLSARTGKNGQMAYWLVVAVICGFVAYGRLALVPA